MSPIQIVPNGLVYAPDLILIALKREVTAVTP